MNVLGVIPARGGSKGIARKNLHELCGKPLLAYSVESSRASRRLTRTILSSDDEEIISVGRSLGLDVPFVRPAHLAADTASSASVALHALEAVEREEQRAYGVVVLLEPTAPLRTASDIDDAVALLLASDADSVVTVSRVEAPHPMKMQVIQDGRLRPFLSECWKPELRRQDLPPVYYLNGVVYAVRADVLRREGTLWGRSTAPLTIPPERSVNIDSLLDFALAEALLRTRP